jgi:hypothetical protein
MLSRTTSLDRSTARLALAVIWSAVVESPHAFDLPRFVWDDATEPSGVSAASEYLARLPKPVNLSASKDGAALVRLHLLPIERRGAHPWRVEWLAQWMRDLGGRRALVLSGGRALRVDIKTTQRLSSDYCLDVPGAGGGGSLGDPWTQGLNLPTSWLRGVSAVFLLGYHSGPESVIPMRRGGEWDEGLLEDLPGPDD